MRPRLGGLSFFRGLVTTVSRVAVQH